MHLVSFLSLRSLLLRKLIIVLEEPVVSTPATLTERAAASAHTPAVSLPDPRIIPFAALAAYFDTPPEPIASASSSIPSSVSSLSADSSSASSAVSSSISTSSSKLIDPTTTRDSTPTAESTKISSPVSTSAYSSPSIVVSSESPVPEQPTSVSPPGIEPPKADEASLIARAAIGSSFELTADELFKRAPAQNGTWGAKRKGLRIKGACVGSKANATTINSLLYYGGKGAVVSKFTLFLYQAVLTRLAQIPSRTLSKRCHQHQ